MFNSALQCSDNDQRHFCYEQVISEYRLSNSSEKFIRVLKSQSAEFPEVEMRNLLEIANIYRLKSKRYADAIATWDKCLRLPDLSNEKKARIRFAQADAYLMLKEIKNEESYLIEALVFDPELYEAHFRLCRLYYNSSDYESALAHANKGLAMNRNADAFFISGLIYKKQK